MPAVPPASGSMLTPSPTTCLGKEPVRTPPAHCVFHKLNRDPTDIQQHRNGDCSLYSGHNGTDNSPYFTSGNTFLIDPFTKTRPALEFPAVPYGPTDFHCERSINDWNNGEAITKGWLVSLADLDSEKPYVQDRIASFLVDLLSIGISGIRIDAAKHIGPASQAQILGRLRNKMGGSLPDDFIAWLEVIVGGESDLNACGGGEWSWYTNFDNKLAAAGLSFTDIQKIKIWSSGMPSSFLFRKPPIFSNRGVFVWLDYPKDMPVCGRWILPPSRFVIQNDDHDQQSPVVPRPISPQFA